MASRELVFLWDFIHVAGFLGVITRLRNPLLAPLRDSPKPRPGLHLVVQCSAGKNWILDHHTWVLGPGTWVRKPGPETLAIG